MTGATRIRSSARPCVPGWALLALGLLFLLRPAWSEEEPPSQPEAAAGETAPETPEPEEEKTPEPTTQQERNDVRWEVEGYLRQEFRYRNVNDEDDFDSYTHVSVDAHYRGKLPFLVRVNGRMMADLAGDQQEDDLLRDVWDGFDGDVQFRLYEAFVESGKLLKAPLTLRGGRQFLDEGVYFHFDGIRADYDLDKVLKHADVSVIFGIPVKFGEGNRDENWLAGFVLRGRIDDRTRGRIEYYHVSEFIEGINPIVVDPLQQPVSISNGHLDDDYVGLTVWHRLKNNLRLFGRFSLLNGDANELNLRCRWFTEDGKWTVIVEWYQLFERLRNVTNDLTPYVPMMGTYQPFYRIGGRGTYRVDEHWIVQAGLSYRALENSSDEGTFNHEYVHYYGSVTWLEQLDGRLDLTLVVNGYDSDQNQVVAVGGHADFELDDRWRLSGGVDYQLYKYDFFADTEREDVWTYTFRARWKWKKNWTVSGGVTVDNDRFDTYTEIDVRLTVRW